MVEQALDLPHKFRKVDPNEVGEEAEQAVGGAYYAGEKHGEEHHRLRPLVQQVEHCDRGHERQHSVCDVGSGYFPI